MESWGCTYSGREGGVICFHLLVTELLSLSKRIWYVCRGLLIYRVVNKITVAGYIHDSTIPSRNQFRIKAMERINVLLFSTMFAVRPTIDP